MARFIGIKDGRVRIASDRLFTSDDMSIVVLPKHLQDVDPVELICDYRIRGTELVPKKGGGDARKMRIAMVGNWKMQCGISTYSENLWPEVAKHFGETKLFIEHNDRPTGDFRKLGPITLADDAVVQCWRRGQSTSDLVKAIKEWDPDVVWMQHEFGLFPQAGQWISLMSQLSEYRVVVTMHSVFYHRDKTICEAAIQEVVVHLAGAKRVLEQEKQIPGKVYVIPHGCYPCTSQEKLWNLYKSDHTFMQFGFGFRYKGWEKAIRATAILKQKYADVFFTGLYSESQFGKLEHQIYFEELQSLIERLGVQENVGIIRGFQSDASLDSYIRTSQVTLFPYVSSPEHEVWGASGAARMAMSKAAPVVTSSVNHFSDLPTIKADTPEEIAAAVGALFESTSARERQIQKQLAYIEENSWANVARKYVDLFERR